MTRHSSRRAFIGTVAAGAGTVLAGCTDSSGVGTEVAGFETVAPSVYDVSLDEGEYAVRQHTAEQRLEFAVAAGIDTGQLLVALMHASEFQDFESSEGYVGTVTTVDPVDPHPQRIVAQFQRGDQFMLVADNTGTNTSHETNGPVEARIEEQAIPV